MKRINYRFFHPQPPEGGNSCRQLVLLYVSNKSPLGDLGVNRYMNNKLN